MNEIATHYPEKIAGTLPKRTEIALDTVDSLEQEEIKKFFSEFPDLGRACLLRHYPMKAHHLRIYADALDWKSLSNAHSSATVFTDELLDEFEARWNWRGNDCLYSQPFTQSCLPGLSTNPNVRWSTELLAQYGNHLHWESISSNPGVQWSLELIDRFIDQWDWTVLSRNKDVPWSEDLIEQFQHHWNWLELSGNPKLPWCEKIITRYADKWNWSELTVNSAINWTPNLLSKFHQYIPSEMNTTTIPIVEVDICTSIDEALLNQLTNITKAKSLNDEGKMRSRKRDYWCDLSTNNSLPWTPELLDKYKEHWDWKALSNNPSLPWTEHFISKFRKQWSWGSSYKHESGLSGNSGIPWSQSLLEQFVDDWDWGDGNDYGISGNQSIPWSKELIDRFKDEYIDWDSLSANPAVAWDMSLIDYFSTYINFDRLCGQVSIKLLNQILQSPVYTKKLSSSGWSSISLNAELDWTQDFYRSYNTHLHIPNILEHQSFGLLKLKPAQIEQLMLEIFGNGGVT